MPIDVERAKFSLTHKDDVMVELVSKTDHKILALWAIDCAERVMPYLRQSIPKIIVSTSYRNTRTWPSGVVAYLTGGGSIVAAIIAFSRQPSDSPRT